MTLNLRQNDPNKIWRDVFEKKQRQKIRVFEKDGFSVSEVNSNEGLKTFYAYYRMNLEHQNVKGIRSRILSN